MLKELGEQESVKEISEKEITTGNLEDDFYYMAGELENASNKLVLPCAPGNFPEGKQKDSREHILEMVLAGDRIHGLYHVIFFQKARQTSGRSGTDSGKCSQWNGSSGGTSEALFKEMSKFVSCYNQAGKKIEELLGNVEKERAD